MPWVRIYEIPAFVNFSHRAHLEAKNTCEDCHGKVAERDALYKEVNLNMGTCMDCHAGKRGERGLQLLSRAAVSRRATDAGRRMRRYDRGRAHGQFAGCWYGRRSRMARIGPQPPCGVPPMPAYPGVGESARGEILERKGTWRGLDSSGMHGVDGLRVLDAGHDGGALPARWRRGEPDAAERRGVVAGRHALLVDDAQEVAGADSRGVCGDGCAGPSEARGHFTPEELKPGAVLYFEQTDNLTGKAIFRLRVREATAERLVFDVANVSAMRYLLMTMFHAGEMQSIYFLDRESDDVWRYYSMARTGKASSSLTTGHEASWINRSVAFFRHMAGIPTDQEPPAAR